MVVDLGEASPQNGFPVDGNPSPDLSRPCWSLKIPSPAPSQFISGLSECYALLRLRALSAGSDAVVWEPPAEFKRTTTKYWVKPEDALWLKARSKDPACFQSALSRRLSSRGPAVSFLF